MKLRRTSQHVDLRTYPLDGVDTYLLSRVEEPLSSEELAELMPCPVEETAQRVQRLLSEGLLSCSDDESESDLVDLGAPELDDDSDLALDFDEAEEALPYPEPDVSFDELEGAAAQAALFAAEPPSTLISLFKRGPLNVAINTVSPPAPIAQVKSEGSAVVRRPTAPDSVTPHDEPTKTHALAKGK